MSQLFNSHKLLFSPNNPTGVTPPVSTPIQNREMGLEDMVDFLRDDGEERDTINLQETPKKETPSPVKEKDKEVPKDEDDESEVEETEEEEEIDELKEIEEELEEPSPEKLALITPVRRKEILKKYPEVFKDFPYLEVAYYRDQQFTELFATPAEAKEAVAAKETLQQFETDVLSGNTETLLKTVKEQDENAFNKIVDNYLDVLGNVDNNARLHVLGNVIKNTIVTMVQEAHRLGLGTAEQPGQGSQLQAAAHILNQFIFGSSQWTPPTQLSRGTKPEDNVKERELAEREQRFVRGQFENSRNDLNNRINNKIKNTITDYIDPKKSMTDYVRKNAERDALDMLDNLLSRDTKFIALKDKLWEKAFEEGFSSESLARIDQAYTAKARTLLPSVLKKARNDAFRGMGRRVREEESTTENKGPVKGGMPRTQNTSGRTGKITNAKDIPRGMSSLEFLNSD